MLKLIVLDVDGVLSGGEAQPFTWPLFERLANLNRLARRGEPLPAISLNTGRPSPYVEAIMQAMDGWQPALYESGAGLYFPQAYRFQISPLVTPEHQALMGQAVAYLDRSLVQPGRAYWQPGKTVLFTLLPEPPLAVSELLAEVEAVAARISDQLVVNRAGMTVNIHPAGIDKGSGLLWLAEETGIDPADMGAVGDSANDADFLRLVGRPAAPANARAEVKAMAQFVASRPDAAGLHDILDHWSLP